MSRIIRPERSSDRAAIEALLDDAFGEDRKERLTVYRLREGAAPSDDLCFVLIEDDTLIASLRFWPVVIGEGRAPALLLGPIAVHRAHRNEGYGLRLMEHGLLQARIEGHERVVLVGDEPYFARLGFRRAPAAALDLPGPYDPERLLGLALSPGGFDGVSGMIDKA